MSDIIHLLPDSVANQIAAGEVIQRPASCLKELVENSLDAGATQIHILVRDAGRTLLQVIDNGKGMSTMDARMAFERHATSKISQAADLFHLHTMGFRGEALASICAVAHIQMQTRREVDEIGTWVEIAGSNVIKQEVVQCPVGTNIKVKNLFFNVPARRKFLKTDQTELRNLLSEYHRIVLVNPDVQFTFVSNDEILSELPACTTKQRIEDVFGHHSKPFTAQLVDVSTSTELINIQGFVGKPEAAGKNSQQYMFVNGRYMRHPYFHKAIISAYAGMLLPDHTPSYFLYFDIHPEAIDVNIHPTKTEIKFADEQAIFQILLAAVRESLGKFNVAPPLDFLSELHIEIPQNNPSKPVSVPHIQTDGSYNPFKSGGRSHEYVPKDWSRLYQPQEQVVTADRHPQENTNAEMLFAKTMLTDEMPVFQWMEKYIVVPVDAGLMFVNQHRAHTAVLYKELRTQIERHEGVSQQLLFPEIVELSQEEMNTLQSIEEELHAVGFSVSQFDPTSYSITSVPGVLGQRSALEILRQLIHSIQDTGGNATAEWQQTIALSLSEQMAIPTGKVLKEIEMRDLISRLLHVISSRYLPNGQTILTILTDENIQRYF